MDFWIVKIHVFINIHIFKNMWNSYVKIRYFARVCILLSVARLFSNLPRVKIYSLVVTA